MSALDACRYSRLSSWNGIDHGYQQQEQLQAVAVAVAVAVVVGLILRRFHLCNSTRCRHRCKRHRPRHRRSSSAGAGESIYCIEENGGCEQSRR